MYALSATGAWLIVELEPLTQGPWRKGEQFDETHTSPVTDVLEYDQVQKETESMCPPGSPAYKFSAPKFTFVTRNTFSSVKFLLTYLK